MIPPSDFTAPALIRELTRIVSQAAAEILRLEDSAGRARRKRDASPVTEADEASERVLLQGLARLLPGVPVVSEESVSRSGSGAMPNRDGVYVLVDPLDGTREFIAGRDEYAVSVAIVWRGRPVAGLLMAPARGRVWRSAAGGHGAERLTLAAGDDPDQAGECVGIRPRRFRPQAALALVSRSHLDAASEACLHNWPGIGLQPCGSALKFAMLADGLADLYPRLSPTCEWDVAAGDAILRAAGGIVVTPQGEPLLYGLGADWKIPGFIAFADPAAARLPLR